MKFSEIQIYNAYFGTRELATALLLTLRNIMPNPNKISICDCYYLDTDNILYIILCPTPISSKKYQFPKHYIVYQLDSTHILEREHMNTTISEALEIWDFSLKNVEYLSNLNIKSTFMPIGYTLSISAQDIYLGQYVYTDNGKDVDILFLGYEARERRQKLKQQLYVAGFRIWFVSDLDISGMQEAIKRSKICINIHSEDEPECLETVRLNILLANQTCIVSEDINDPELEIYKDYIIISEYKDMLDTCKKLIAQPQQRKELAIKSWQWYRTREWSKICNFKEALMKYV